MEFLLAGLGLAIAAWMIWGARNRHRSNRAPDPPGDDDQSR